MLTSNPDPCGPWFVSKICWSLVCVKETLYSAINRVLLRYSSGCVNGVGPHLERLCWAGPHGGAASKSGATCCSMHAYTSELLIYTSSRPLRVRLQDSTTIYNRPDCRTVRI